MYKQSVLKLILFCSTLYILITSIYIYLSVTSELENKLTKTEICALVTEYLGSDCEIHIKLISVCVWPKWTHKLELDLSLLQLAD